MLGSIRDWLLGLTAAVLAGHLILEVTRTGIQAGEVRCTMITVIDDQGRPRIILDGTANDALISVLDDAGTARLVVSMEQEPNEEVVDSAIRLELRDFKGRRALELIQEGNHNHGGSERIGIYGSDLEERPEQQAMFGTSVLAGWPHLEISPEGGGRASFGLADYGEPYLLMMQSPNRPGLDPGTVETRNPKDLGWFRLGPGPKLNQVLIGEQELVTRPMEK